MPKSSNTTTKNKPDHDNDRVLARALVEKGVLNIQQAKAALTQLKNEDEDKTLEDILAESGTVEPEVVLETKASLWHVPFIDLKNYEIDPEVLELVPGQMARAHQFFPLFRIDGTLLIAMADPKDVTAIDEVTRITQLEISPALSDRKAVADAISKHYGNEPQVSDKVSNEEIKGIIEIIEAEEEETKEIPQSTQDLARQAEEAPVVKMANMILTQAIVEGASDVHINPEETGVRVRFRVDGVLRDSIQLPKHLQSAVVSRIKILANLDIAENRIPQDGQLRIKLKDGRDIDIRVSTLPNVHGENVVMRILDKDAGLLKLENLGFEDDVLTRTMDLLGNSYGIILVTGPTGSGKTTTLYSALNHLNSVEKNIITLEDPVEYRLPLIRQSQVNVKAGMTFAKGLRAILRQDPDIVMVGEIRDSETANIAVQAALTGHLVLSTLHTNDAAGAVTRLSEMGIEPFLVSSAVLGVMAQRLVRTICKNCKEEYEPQYKIPNHIVEHFGLGEDSSSMKFYRGKGCKRCKDTGYRGRMSLIEILPMTEGLREMVLQEGSADDLKRRGIDEGMRPLLYDGWVKIFKGLTTLEEVMRVTNIG